jgi:hypothetical protein
LLWVGDTMQLITRMLAATVLAVVGASSSNAFAGSILAAATRTKAFTSTSKSDVLVPLQDNGATALQFTTADDNQIVKITYNAECEVTGTRGKWASVRILVDGNEANPASGNDFALCSAVDTVGKTWGAATRQSVFNVPTAGTHAVTVLGRLNVGFTAGSGTWRLDDSSLVVETAVLASATRTAGFQSTAAAPDPEVALPLKPNGGKTLLFDTSTKNALVRISYNAECDLAAPQPGKLVDLTFTVDGSGVNPGALSVPLCGSVDTTGKTWVGALTQFAIKVPTAGSHALKVFGILNVGPGSWQVDDSSVVAESAVRASAVRTSFESSSTVEVALPLTKKGAETLTFTTAASNELVTITYSALCGIAAPRGKWVSIRIVVDGQEANPASGGDFALCSSLETGAYNYATAARQSTITIATAGDHTVQIFGKASSTAAWGLAHMSLVVK